MELRDRAVALYGRFSPGERDRLQRDILPAAGRVARDLTRRSDVLVVGALAAALVDSGALAARLAAAQSRGVPVWASAPSPPPSPARPPARRDPAALDGARRRRRSREATPRCWPPLT